MRPIETINDFVLKFANVNGSGSASANRLIARAIFRMGVPVAPKNIFPSNIQGLPTWYEIRVNERGFLARREGIDVMVAMNAATFEDDVAAIRPGGYLVHDTTFPKMVRRDDIVSLGLPFTELCDGAFRTPDERKLLKNIMCAGALSTLLDIDAGIMADLVRDQYKRKAGLIPPNLEALEMGRNAAREAFDCPLSLKVQASAAAGDSILMDGNRACALGAIWGGATVAAWYPITPSSSLTEAFARHAPQLRPGKEDGKNRFVVVQAEDEIAAVGIAIGAGWNGARAFTATSGPGISLMSEFLGLAYMAEVPLVLFAVQRGGPSTGMPTRTQQSDLLISAYASHGDTRHLLLFPANPQECFDLSAQAFDLADRFQTPVIVLTDLDLGMNEWCGPPLHWQEGRTYDRGKVMTSADLDQIERFGRYLDSEGDGIGPRTLPGTHPSKGAYFTRGTSHDAYAAYTEDGAVHADMLDRIERKFRTATRHYLPGPLISSDGPPTPIGVAYFGSTEAPMPEAVDLLRRRGIRFDRMRIRSFPFNDEVRHFIDSHETVFVIEQNRDGQMRKLLIAEEAGAAEKLVALKFYDGMPVTAQAIAEALMGWLDAEARAGRIPGRAGPILDAGE